MRTRYTYDTVRSVVARCRGVQFVWIMGADNLRSFHRWQKWRGIAALVPIAVVDRVGPSLYATGGAAAQALARYPHSRGGRAIPAPPPPARLGVPAWAQVAALLHGAAGGTRAPMTLPAPKLSHKGRAKPRKWPCGTSSGLNPLTDDAYPQCRPRAGCPGVLNRKDQNP